jgi:acyl-CoA synthetase (NDP forming)
VAMLGEEMLAVGRYDRVPGTDRAEVAFLVDDAHQGRGLGSVLLEHLAAIAAERDIASFEAEVLSDNYRMVGVFVDAGYQANRSYEEDAIHLVFSIEPTVASVAVMQSREHRAEARSIGRLLTPRSVAVVGASPEPRTVGHTVLVNLLRSGFNGPVYPVSPDTGHVQSVRAYPSVDDIPGDVDLAVLAVDGLDVAGAALDDVIEQCARKRVRGLVVLPGGFSETGPATLEASRMLVAKARANGMRVIGPNCLGIMNTTSDVSLNATLAPALPRGGRAGFFSQSGALGIAILESVRQRGIGLSSFVSAGDKIDVSGNDLLQYWEDDPATDVVLLHLESFGNPRKFARLARRLGRQKPIIAVKSAGPVAARLGQTVDPESAVDALFRQAGVIRVDTLSQLFDVAQVLLDQPLPTGRRVAVVGNSAALGRLAAEACAGNGLEVGPLSSVTQEALSVLHSDVVVDNPLLLLGDSGPHDLERAMAAVLADLEVDAVVTVLVPPLRDSATEVAAALAAATTANSKPVVATFLALDSFSGPDSTSSSAVRAPSLPLGRIPSFPSPEVAVAALARATSYGRWRSEPEGEAPTLAGIDPDAARAVLDRWLLTSPAGGALPAAEVAAVLAAYGVRVWSDVVVSSVDEATAAAAQLDYPVALKATAPSLRHRPELGTVRLNLESAEELEGAFHAMAARLGVVEARLAVQAMAPAGVPTVVRTVDDASFGALMSFGIGGVATDLLGDRAFQVLPLTDIDVRGLVRGVRAAPLLLGYRGSEPVDVAALEQVLLRVGELAYDLPAVAELELNPVIVSREGVSVLRATARVAAPRARLDTGPRRMRQT